MMKLLLVDGKRRRTVWFDAFCLCLETQIPDGANAGTYRAKDGAYGYHAYCFVRYVEAHDGNTQNQDEIQDGQTQPRSQQDDMCVG